MRNLPRAICHASGLIVHHLKHLYVRFDIIVCDLDYIHNYDEQRRIKHSQRQLTINISIIASLVCSSPSIIMRSRSIVSNARSSCDSGRREFCPFCIGVCSPYSSKTNSFNAKLKTQNSTVNVTEIHQFSLLLLHEYMRYLLTISMLPIKQIPFANCNTRVE